MLHFERLERPLFGVGWLVLQQGLAVGCGGAPEPRGTFRGKKVPSRETFDAEDVPVYGG